MIKKIYIVILSLLIGSVIFPGCEGKDDNSEAVRAELLLPKVQKDLDTIRRRYNSLSEQLRVVQHERDQFAIQIRQLTADGQNVEEIKIKFREQAERINFLEEQIEELNTTIESQRTTISGHESTIAELIALIEQQNISNEQQEIIDQQEVVEQEEFVEEQAEGY